MPWRTVVFAVAFGVAVGADRLLVQPGTGAPITVLSAGVLVWWSLAVRSRGEALLGAGLVAAITVLASATAGHPVAYLGATVGAPIGLAVGTRVAASLFARTMRHGQSDGSSLVAMGTPSDAYRLISSSTVGVLLGLPFTWWMVRIEGNQPVVNDLVTVALRSLGGISLVAGTGLAVAGWRTVTRWPARAEVAGVFGVTIAFDALVYLTRGPLSLVLALVLLTFWSAVRMPVPLAAAHAGTVTALGSLMVLAGGDRFSTLPDPRIVAMAIQFVSVLGSGFALIVSTAMNERDALAAILARSERQARRQAQDLANLTATIPDGLLVVDRAGHVEVLNDAGEQLMGSPGPGAARLPASLRTLGGEPMAEQQRPAARALAGEIVRGVPVVVGDVRPGLPQVFEISAAPLRRGPDDQPTHAVLLFRDLTDTYDGIEQLRRKREEAERLFADAPHGIAVLDRRGRVVKGNDALAGMLGCAASDLVGRRLEDFSPESSAVLTAHLREVVARGGELVGWDWLVTGSDGIPMRLALTGRLLEGRAEQSDDTLLVNVVDVSERQRYESRLDYLSSHDVLTGLRNRRWFDGVLTEAMERFRVGGAGATLMVVDVDHFNEVNDTLGHAAGDRLLGDVARLLTDAAPEQAVVARLGGDEFALLVPDSDHERDEGIARTILERIRSQSATFDGVLRHVTASVGVVPLEAADGHPAGPLALADLVLADAKETGRDRFAVLEPGADRQPRTGVRLAWKHRLEEALEKGLFQLHLQPIAEVRTGRIVAAEALIRLVDGDELVLPGSFVHIAEQTGLAPRLDSWVITDALRTLGELRAVHPRIRLGVNVSGRSVGHPLIERTLLDGLRTYGVDPRNLVIEVTETAAVDDVLAAREFAERVSAIGAGVALDDFGAGFGTFSYLKHLVFDVIKINGEFVAHAPTSAIDRSILRSIVGISKDLGKHTVAEFVETTAALDLVRAEGIDFAQGYLIGRPCPLPSFVEQFLPRHTDEPAGTWLPTATAPNPPRS